MVMGHVGNLSFRGLAKLFVPKCLGGGCHGKLLDATGQHVLQEPSVNESACAGGAGKAGATCPPRASLEAPQNQ